jgi:adenylate cyclase
MTQTPKSPSPTKEEIYRQLERVLSSPDFNASSQQIAFLKFVVDQTLDGNAGLINDHTVATQVFGRGPEFDLSVDPVVGIQASLLRRALERYYSTGGKDDPVRINIPVGTYVPEFL